MSDWKGRRVFVTGGTGLLGSRLVERLVELDAEVTCLVRDWVPASRLVTEGGLAKANTVRGELEDGPLILRALNEYEIDSVFHLGAQAIVGTANRSPLSTFESNIKGTWLLLDACRELGNRIERVVVASSDKAYGAHELLPYKEDAPLQGRFPYDVSKSCADLISISYHRSFGIPVSITRCGNLYGAGDLNFNRLVPGTIRSALLNENPIIRSDGTFVRDYFYVKDAVEAYLQLAVRMPDPTLDGEAFNFGTEEPMSVLDLVAMLLRLMDAEHLKPEILGQGSREIPAQYLDCEKARQLLDWEPEFTLEQGLRETIDWYRRTLAEDAGTGAGVAGV